MASQKTFLAAPKTPNLSASPDLNPKKSPRKRGMSSHHSSAPGTITWLTPRDILEPLGKFDGASGNYRCRAKHEEEELLYGRPLWLCG